MGLVLAFLPLFSAADWDGASREWSLAPDWSVPASAAPNWTEENALPPDGFAPWSGAGNGYRAPAGSDAGRSARGIWREGAPPAGQGWPGGYRFRPDGDPSPGGTGPDGPWGTPWGGDPVGVGGYRWGEQDQTPGWGGAQDPARYRFRPLTEQEQNGRRRATGTWRPSVPAAALPPEPRMSYPGTPSSAERDAAPATGGYWGPPGPHPR